MRQSSAECRFNRRQRGIRLRGVGTTGLRHIGPAAAAFAAKRLGAFAHQVDSIEALDQIVGHADHDAGLAVVRNSNNSDNTRADLLLAFVSEAAQVLELDAVHYT